MNADSRPDKQSEETVELVFHNIHEHGVEIINMWIKEVEKRTGGRMHITLRTGEDRSLIESADIVRDVPAEGGNRPLLDLIQFPFIFPNSTIGSRVLAQLYAEFPELREELSDVKVVGLGIGALMAVFSSRKWGPIRNLEDFRGATTRSLTVIDGIIESFGAKPVHVGFLNMGQLLETGEIDAAVLGVLPSWVFKFAEGPAPYCTVAGDLSLTMHPMRTYIRWDSWNRLPQDIRDTLDEIGPAGSDCWFAVQSGLDADKQLEKALDYIRRNGELIMVPPVELERWRDIVQPHLDAAINTVEERGLPGKLFYNRMKELVASYSRQE